MAAGRLVLATRLQCASPCRPRQQGPIHLNSLAIESGHLGANCDAAKGGYQPLSIALHANFVGDKSSASWLINAEYAADWQQFQHEGGVKSAKRSRQQLLRRSPLTGHKSPLVVH